MKYKVACSVLAVLVVSSMLLLASTDRPEATQSTATIAPATSGGFTFEGCWTQSQGGQCYDIFRDSSGNYWKCKKCGETKNANQGSCAPIGITTLNSGFWCS